MSGEAHGLQEHHRRVLRGLACRLCRHLRLRQRFDEADVVQETLLKAHEKRGQFRGTTEAERLTWLGEILHNTFHDMVDRELTQKRNPGRERSLHAAGPEVAAGWDAVPAAVQPSPSQQLESDELRLRLADALRRLPAEQREVVVLRYLRQTPVRQIAAQLGRTEKSVAGLLLRGRQALRQFFPDYQ
jgi:RNA polymerase sigma-70 factor (ECF subfamily)